jgi:hypothetical protein
MGVETGDGGVVPILVLLLLVFPISPSHFS